MQSVQFIKAENKLNKVVKKYCFGWLSNQNKQKKENKVKQKYLKQR